MKECPWCGRKNLSVHAYCHGCGRGFGELEKKTKQKPRRRPFVFLIKS